MKRSQFVLTFVLTFVLCLLVASVASGADRTPLSQPRIDANAGHGSVAAALPSGTLNGPAPGSRSYWADDFNRPDSSDMGPDWTEMQGDLAITSNYGHGNLSTGWSYMEHTSASSAHDVTPMQIDLLPPIGSSGPHVALITGVMSGSTSWLYTKVQDNDSDGNYDRIFFYSGANTGAWGTQYYQDLATPISTGRIFMYVTNNGDTMNVDIDNDFNGTIDEHFENTGILALGLNFGTGFGIGAWAGGAFDNWEVGIGGSPSVDITCNGGDSAVLVPSGTNAKLDFDIYAGAAGGTPVDIWIVLVSPFGPFCYNGAGPISGWNMGVGFAYFTGPLASESGTALDRPLPLGSYKAHLGLDIVPNGSLDIGSVVIRDVVDFTVF